MIANIVISKSSIQEQDAHVKPEGECEDAVLMQEGPGAVREQSQEEVRATLARDVLVWKFCFYGFFKNLELFDSFLWAVLLSWGYLTLAPNL